MPSQTDIRKAITDQIIAALENGNVPPWRRPWKLGKNAGAHGSLIMPHQAMKNTHDW
jgi:antirestriction protein ArdC